MRNTLPVADRCQLGYFDRNRIERAIDQSARNGNPVATEIIHGGRKFRVLISPALDPEAVLASRA